MEKLKADIIPTPKYLKISSDTKKIYSKGKKYRIFVNNPDPKTMFAASFFKEKVKELHGIDFLITEKGKPGLEDIVICRDENISGKTGTETDLSSADMSIFGNSMAAEQGYVISAKEKTPVFLYGCSATGCLYASATALQLFEKVEDKPSFPLVNVRDWPDFKYRGNNWLIWAETGGWSYDRGDGPEKYTERIIRKLDMSLMYKINFIIFKGLGWNSRVFPGYAGVMRKINREARIRSIHLCCAGYGSCYGSGSKIYNSTIHKNRFSYPDGKEYRCIGHSNAANSRLNGTCLSNRTLLKYKQEELESFVRNVEPGALYIHNLDAGKIEISAPSWLLRCKKCRKRWPNDDINAPDGMAGAYASFYDALAEAVQRVNKSSAGYMASRDCLSVMVSPGYSSSTETDEQWSRHIKYWTSLSSFMKNNSNVLFGFREQFRNMDNGLLRTGMMAEALSEKGKKHGMMVIPFYGGDGWRNDYLFNGAPVMTAIYEGAEALINASGNAYREPQQLLNAEYAWNSKNSAFMKGKTPATYTEASKLFTSLGGNSLMPEKLFGKKGFLETACRKLYGHNAGTFLAEIYRMKGKKGESPLLHLWNTFLNYLPDKSYTGSNINIIYGKLAGAWEEDISPDKVAERRLWLKNTRKLTCRAEKLLQEASRCSVTDNVKDDLSWLLKSSNVAGRFLYLMDEYLAIYETLQRTSRAEIKKQKKMLEALQSLSQNIENLERHISENFKHKIIDYLGADMLQWNRLILFLRNEVEDMEVFIKTGKRVKRGIVIKWE